MKLMAIAGVFFVFIMQILNCTGYSVTGERISSPADFTGFITCVQSHGDKSGYDTVFAESHANKMVSRYVILVTSKTLIFKLNGDKYNRITFDSLIIQDQIQVWFDEPVRKTKPVSGKAKQVVVINHY